jgi:Zn-dependent alcohol dehydrogenases
MAEHAVPLRAGPRDRRSRARGGSNVRDFKVGDLAGVGCMVDSCRHCPSCAEGEEQYCENGFVGTYNGPMFGGENTLGGYSDHIVVDMRYVLKIRHEDNLAAVAPLLCAGITTYSPLAHWKVGPGRRSAWLASVAWATWR